MLEINKIDDSDVFLACVKKDLFERRCLTTVGYIVKIGNEIKYKSDIETLSNIKTLNFFDTIKVNRMIKELSKCPTR